MYVNIKKGWKLFIIIVFIIKYVIHIPRKTRIFIEGNIVSLLKKNRPKTHSIMIPSALRKKEIERPEKSRTKRKYIYLIILSIIFY
jgi:hypothetical protein